MVVQPSPSGGSRRLKKVALAAFAACLAFSGLDSSIASPPDSINHATATTIDEEDYLRIQNLQLRRELLAARRMQLALEESQLDSETKALSDTLRLKYLLAERERIEGNKIIRVPKEGGKR